VKTTFDLPHELVRKAKAVAAQQGRPLRDLVAEAIDEKLEVVAGGGVDATKAREVRREAWERWKGRLERRSDGTWFNPEGVDDESFFQSLEEVRREPWVKRDPFGSDT
jgi:predicted DNA-binding protein